MIGIYVRQSRDDDGENIDTIETQRDLLIDFAKNKFGEIYKVYIDDNVSGSIFERKGIEDLKKDIELKKIDMLILKDLSRLGRNNAKTLLFLDYLEEYNIRVITFDGRYDSDKDNDTVGIDTWYNERYIKDISKKIRANLRYKIQKGEYIGSSPFGYKKSLEQKNKLVIDEETANIVKEIYNLYESGLGYSSISKKLSEIGYISPSASDKWNPITVKRILSNRVYIGDTVQGISEKISFKSKKTRMLDTSEWVITENTHDAIIAKDRFLKIQSIIAGKHKGFGPHKEKINLFRGLLFCGKCQSSMFSRVRGNGTSGYICSRYAKNGKKDCNSHFVNEKVILEIVINEINNLINNKEIIDKAICLFKQGLENTISNEERIKGLKKQLSQKLKQQEALYMDKLSEKISEELFLRINKNLEINIEMLNNQLINEQATVVNSLKAEELFIDTILSIAETNITNEIIRTIVDKIIVFEPNEVDAKENIDMYLNGGIKILFKY